MVDEKLFFEDRPRRIKFKIQLIGRKKEWKTVLQLRLDFRNVRFLLLLTHHSRESWERV